MPQKVFVTGATGYIGYAVARALVARGYHVTGLTRDDSKKDKLRKAGISPFSGTLASVDAGVLAAYDAVIHAAADYSNFATLDNAVVDAIASMSKTAAEHKKQFVGIYTSGCLVVGDQKGDDNEIVTEESPIATPPGLQWRVDNEQKVVAASKRNAVIRPVFVWGGVGSHGSTAYGEAQKGKQITVVGEPSGKFGWIHVEDLAEQYAVLLQQLLSADGEKYGGVYHGADGRPSFHHKDVFTAFAKALGDETKVVSISRADGEKAMGAFGAMLCFQQNRFSADKFTRIGWFGPRFPSVLDGADQWVADLHGRPTVLVTGASGYIGSSVVKALVERRYRVLGLIRDRKKEPAVYTLGGEPVVGDLGNMAALAPMMKEVTAVVHCGVDYTNMVVTEEAVVKSLASFAHTAHKEGRHLSVVFTSGCLILGDQQIDPNVVITEETKLNTPKLMQSRVLHENYLLQHITRTAVLRPGFVWGGVGSHGSTALDQAQKDGHITVIGEPSGMFPWVHLEDLTDQYVILVDKLLERDGHKYRGVYHGVDGRPSIAHTEVFGAFAKQLESNVKVQQVPLASARAYMGPFADLFAMRQNRVSADKLHRLGWTGPKHGTPIEGAAGWVGDLRGQRKTLLVTGGNGYIGSEVTRALVRRGYRVIGLVRETHKGAVVRRSGGEPLVAQLKILGQYVGAHEGLSGIVHCGCDFTDPSVDNGAVDGAVQAVQAAQQKKKEPFVYLYTSGCLMCGLWDPKDPAADTPMTEDMKLEAPEELAWRKNNEQRSLAAGKRCAVLRPVFVWGKKGSHGLRMYNEATKSGTISVIGEPGGHYSWIHIEDLAQQYATLVDALFADEKASGLYFGSDDSGRAFYMKEVAAGLAAKIGNVKVVHTSIEAARAARGGFAPLLAGFQRPVAAAKLRKLGWAGPQHSDPVTGADEWYETLRH